MSFRLFHSRRLSPAAAFPRSAAWLLPLLALGFGFAAPSRAATLTVTTTADSGTGSLRAALAASSADGDGDVITFDPTVFATRQTISVGGNILFAYAGVTIQGPAAGVVLDGGSVAVGNGPPCLVFESTTATSAVSNLTIQNFGDTGLTNSFGTVTVTHCVLQGNSSEHGAGVSNEGTMTLIGCTVAGNTTSQDGAGIVNSGTMTLTGCTVSGNVSGNYGGGGIENGGNLTLADCTVTNNVAGGSDGGGGIASLDGFLTAVNCTFTGNRSNAYDNVYGGGGAIALVRGTTVLTNDIFFGDSSPQGGGDEVFFNNNNNGNPGTVTITRCDIAPSAIFGSAYTSGGGSISADPHLGPLQNNGGPTQTRALLAGSPCINAGTAAGAPAADQRGAGRSGAPDIGAYEFQGGASSSTFGHTHLLWTTQTSAGGTAAIWTIAADGSVTSTPAFGPIPGWTAKSIADGSDGLTRLLWSSTGGESAVWTVNTATDAITSTPGYAVGGGWITVGLAVGLDNLTRLQWEVNPAAHVGLDNAVWTLDSAGNVTSSTPPYEPNGAWTARALAVGSDGFSRLLWINGENPDGAAPFAVWTINGAGGFGGFASTPLYNPQGWMATTIAGGPDTNARLLLNRGDGAMAVWTVDVPGSVTSTPLYGPIPGYSCHALAVGPDALSRVLWSRNDGASAVWTINADGSVASTPLYGPIAGWNAVAVSVGP